MRIADNGDLVLATDGGDVRMKKPILYQEIAGVRVPVSGGYRLRPLPRGEGRGEGKHARPPVPHPPSPSKSPPTTARAR
jgi:hypothetical protein